jgi:hypothetical protein
LLSQAARAKDEDGGELVEGLNEAMREMCVFTDGADERHVKTIPTQPRYRVGDLIPNRVQVSYSACQIGQLCPIGNSHAALLQGGDSHPGGGGGGAIGRPRVPRMTFLCQDLLKGDGEGRFDTKYGPSFLFCVSSRTIVSHWYRLCFRKGFL